MSHYTVLVITEDGNYEKALEPFDENLEVEQYIKKTKEEIIKEEKKRYEKRSDKDSEYCQNVDWSDDNSIVKHYFEYWEEEHDENYNELSSYNPNSKYDWYQLGGRWAGSLKLKNGAEKEKDSELSWYNCYEDVPEGYTDHAQFKDIDLTPDKEQVEKAKRFWEVVVEGQPKQEGEKFDTFWKPEYYKEQYGDKETYIKCQTELFACALLYKGEWIEAGQMGWFACKNSTKESEEEYRKNFYEVISNLKPTDYLSMVDCHI